MLKTRLMPTLLYKDTTLVKGIGFDSWRRVGSVMQSVKVYNLRQVDELVFMDITATRDGREPDFGLVDEFADECFMPLTVGGGIKTVDHVSRLLAVGADKVSIGTAATENPDLVTKIADKFGSQCVVVSIDYSESDRKTVRTHSGAVGTERDPVELSKEMEERGAGEILLTCIERDGAMNGYDVEMIAAVSSAVRIPVIASGGAGNPQHMLDAIVNGQASAVAAASVFHFTELTPREAKQYLREHGIPMRP